MRKEGGRVEVVALGISDEKRGSWLILQTLLLEEGLVAKRGTESKLFRFKKQMKRRGSRETKMEVLGKRGEWSRSSFAIQGR